MFVGVAAVVIECAVVVGVAAAAVVVVGVVVVVVFAVLVPLLLVLPNQWQTFLEVQATCIFLSYPLHPPYANLLQSISNFLSMIDVNLLESICLLCSPHCRPFIACMLC